MKLIKFKKAAVLFALTAALSGQVITAQAATDKTAPKITYTLSTKEATNGTVKINAKVTDASKIVIVRWLSGSHDTKYMQKHGKKLTLKKSTVSVTVKKNGTYTFYAKDSSGNTVIKKVKISNIDTALPVIEAVPSTTEYTNKSLEAQSKCF